MKTEVKIIIERFIEKLKKKVGEDKILCVYLYGSHAKSLDTEESDIDVLVVYEDLDEWLLHQQAADISYEILLETGELIQFMPMHKKDFDGQVGKSPFLYEVLKFGKKIYSKLKTTQWKLEFDGYFKLAVEYLDYAKSGLKLNKLRLAIDTAYNACELLVKALIVSTNTPLATSHKGIINQFSKLFVLAEKLPKQIGRKLNMSFDLRNKARYRWDVELSVEQAEFVIDLAEKLLEYVKTSL